MSSLKKSVGSPEDDYIEAKRTIERREKKKLFDNIDSILHRLELERVKPSFEVQQQTGFRRSSSLARKNKRFSRASTCDRRSPSSDRASVVGDAIFDRARNRMSLQCEPQSHLKRESLAREYSPANRLEIPGHRKRESVARDYSPASRRDPHQRASIARDYSPAKRQSLATDYSPHHQNREENLYRKAGSNFGLKYGGRDPYGAETQLKNMKEDFLGEFERLSKRDNDQSKYSQTNNYRIPEKRSGFYPINVETSRIYPNYSTTYPVVNSKQDQPSYGGAYYQEPSFSNRKTYYAESDGPGQSLLSQYRSALRDTQPVVASFDRDPRNVPYAYEWAYPRPQSTPPTVYRSSYTPVAEYRNYGLGLVGRKVAESHNELEYLNRLIDRTFGKAASSYQPSPASYYVSNFRSPVTPYSSDYTIPSYSSYVPTYSVRTIPPNPYYNRYASVFSYQTQPKHDFSDTSRRHSVLISPPTRVTKPGRFESFPSLNKTTKADVTGFESILRSASGRTKTRPMSYAAGTGFNFYK